MNLTLRNNYPTNAGCKTTGKAVAGQQKENQIFICRSVCKRTKNALLMQKLKSWSRDAAIWTCKINLPLCPGVVWLWDNALCSGQLISRSTNQLRVQNWKMRMTKNKWSMTFTKSLNKLILSLNNCVWTEITTTARDFREQIMVTGEERQSSKESGDKIWLGFRLKIGFHLKKEKHLLTMKIDKPWRRFTRIFKKALWPGCCKMKLEPYLSTVKYILHLFSQKDKLD